MKKILLLALPAALAACQPNAPQTPRTPQAPPAAYPPANHFGQTDLRGRFECENGMQVQIENLDNSNIRLTLSGDGDPGSKQVVMQRGASGEYFSRSGLYGGGGEWRNGTFAYTRYDGSIAQTQCR